MTKMMLTIAAVAVMAAACSTPESQPPATTAQPAADAPAAAPSASQPAAPVAPAPAPPSAAAPSPATAPAPAAPPPPPKPKVAQLNAGHVLTIRTTRELTTKTAKTGDAFSAVLEEPIAVEGWVVAAPGAKVDGRVVEADKGGRVKGKASLTIELVSLTIADGRKVEIVTSPVSNEAAANKGKDAAKIGIGAGAGAAVGAIAGGGTGAAIGAVVGGGAATALRGDSATIPAETLIGFELRSPVTIQEVKK
jgi:hypothetical protein